MILNENWSFKGSKHWKNGFVLFPLCQSTVEGKRPTQKKHYGCRTNSDQHQASFASNTIIGSSRWLSYSVFNQLANTSPSMPFISFVVGARVHAHSFTVYQNIFNSKSSSNRKISIDFSYWEKEKRINCLFWQVWMQKNADSVLCAHHRNVVDLISISMLKSYVPPIFDSMYVFVESAFVSECVTMNTLYLHFHCAKSYKFYEHTQL